MWQQQEYTDEEVEEFQEQLQSTVDLVPNKDVLVVQGDWNAKMELTQQVDGLTYVENVQMQKPMKVDSDYSNSQTSMISCLQIHLDSTKNLECGLGIAQMGNTIIK